MKRCYRMFSTFGALLLAFLLAIPISISAQTATPFIQKYQPQPQLYSHHPDANTDNHRKSGQQGAQTLETVSNYWSRLAPEITGSNTLPESYTYGPFMEDDRGRLWIGNQYGISIYSGIDWMNLNGPDAQVQIPRQPTAMVQPKQAYFDGNMNYYIGTSYGLFIVGSQLQFVDPIDTNRNNIKSNRINDLHFAHGKLWIAHQFEEANGGGVTEGLSRYEYSPVPEDSIKGNVLEIAETSDGKLWFAVAPDTTADDAGVYTYHPSDESWTVMNTTNSNLPSDQITGIAVDNSDNVWVGFQRPESQTASALLAKYEPSSGNWTTYNASDFNINGSVILELLVDDNTGNLWAGTDQGLYSFDGSNWSEITASDSRIFTNRVNAAYQRNDGSVVLGTSSNKNGVLGGVATYDSGNWSFMSTYTDNGFPLSTIFASARDDKGNMWFSGFRGLVKYDGSAWTHYDATDGMDNSYAWSMLYDSQGRLWLGTSGDSTLSMLKDGNFTTFDTPGEFYGESLYEDSNGNIWFGSYNQNAQEGILMYDGTDFNKFSTNEGLTANYVFSIGELPNGNIVASTFNDQDGYAIMQYDGSNWSTLNVAGTTERYISTIKADHDGNVWFAGSNLYKWDGSNWTTYTTDDDYIGATEDMAINSDGDLLIAGYYGMQVLSDGKFRNIGVSNSIRGYGLYTIDAGPDGGIWVGSNGGGVSHYQEATDITINAVDDLPDDEGGRVSVDIDGFLLDPFRVPQKAPETASWTVWRKDGSNWVSMATVPLNQAQSKTVDVAVPTTAETGNVQAGDKYTFRVSANRNDGSVIAYSDAKTGYAIDNHAPAKVTGVSKTDQTSGVTLSWDPVDADDLEEYAVYLLKGDGSIPDNALKTSTSNSVDISGASSDREFVVKAKDRHNNYGKASDPVTVTDIDKGRQLPDRFTLEKNYPNPFNPTTSIPFALPEASKVTINVYNILGSKVATLTNKRYSAGEHQVSFQANGLASGTYIIRARMGKEVFERKIMLLK
jgi:ligand-binding sensor domain-containing protein